MSKRATQHNFAISPQNQVPRSSFKRSHTVKTTLDAGRLVPFYIDEVYPGDTFNCKATLFGRMATPIVPAMDNAYMDTCCSSDICIYYKFNSIRKIFLCGGRQ